MKQRFIWGLALWAGAALLSGCASRTEVRPPTQLVTPEPVRAATNPLTSNYHFEAERAAMAQGCMGPGQVRPVSQITRKQGSLEWFDVACAERVQRVRCDIGMCTPIR